MRVLITGLAGFAGSHLADYLSGLEGLELHGTARVTPPHAPAAVTVHAVDLRDVDATEQLFDDLAPDITLHLAGQSFVPLSWRDPWGTLETNVRAQVNLLQALQKLGHGRMLVVGSNEEYGAVTPADLPVREDTPLRPASPYGVSKVAQDLLGHAYALSHGLEVVRVRPFNHIGPRQNERFVASAFARQIAVIEQGLAEPVLRVGNLEAQRDFSDVRDVVRAYWLAVTRGVAGAVYNVGSGQPRRVRTLLDELLARARCPIEVVVDPARLRPVDIPISYCDARALQAATGWAPEIPFTQTVHDVLMDWRARRPTASLA